MTDSDSGENRYLAVPVNRNTGTKTTLIDSVGKKSRHSNFRRAVDDGLVQRLVESDVPLDVLDHHRGVVDQNAHRERETAERHGVERLAGDIEHQHGRNDRQRNGGQDDQRQPPVAKEQQNHQRGQTRRHQAAHDHAVQAPP